MHMSTKNKEYMLSAERLLSLQRNFFFILFSLGGKKSQILHQNSE